MQPSFIQPWPNQRNRRFFAGGSLIRYGLEAIESSPRFVSLVGPVGNLGSLRRWLALDPRGKLIQRGFEFGHLRVDFRLDLRRYSHLARRLQVVMHLFFDLLVLRFQTGNRVNLRLREFSLGMGLKTIEDCLGFLQLRAYLLLVCSDLCYVHRFSPSTLVGLMRELLRRHSVVQDVLHFLLLITA